MASFTAITRKKRARRHANAGKARKAKQAKKSTLSYDELFASCGVPGQAAPGVGTSTSAGKR
jgi:hypothetical protein